MPSKDPYLTLNNGRFYIEVDGNRFDVTDAFDEMFTPDPDEVPFCDDDAICDCAECLMNDDCHGFEVGEDFEDDDFAPPMWGIPAIEHIIFNEPATIVFWDDGTKTVVKCMDGEKFERYAGFIAACAKKMFGSTSRAKAIMEECAYDQPKPEKKKKDLGVKVPDLTQAFNEVIANREAAEEAVNEALAR